MLINSDAARIPLADKSVHTCVTSPPYWGLRKYSGEQGRIWGGDAECVHVWKKGQLIRRSNDGGKSEKQLSNYGANRRDIPIPYSTCQLCGAWYGSLGLEPTPELFIQHMIAIFREVRRVLRDDGVVWINLGDSYASSWASGRRSLIGNPSRTNRVDRTTNTPFKEGDLCLMPHRVAIALQDDGWIIRQDLVWSKPNPMPESQAGWRFERSRKIIGDDPRGNEGEKRNATLGQPPQRDHDGPNFAQPNYEYGEDYELRKGSWRHTRAHEYVFMLTKKMQYWSNQEAVREPNQDIHHSVGTRTMSKNHKFKDGDSKPSRAFADYDSLTIGAGRNPRSVLDIPTAPYKHAHYATYPPNLIAPLIRATCPRWACPVCGQGWSPVVEKEFKGDWQGDNESNADPSKVNSQTPDRKNETGGGSVKAYRPTCDHPHTIEDAVPGIVLDPFIGSGTTGQVARELQLRWIGLDISMEYIDLQAKVRTKSGSPSNELDDLPLFDKELV